LVKLHRFAPVYCILAYLISKYYDVTPTFELPKTDNSTIFNLCPNNESKQTRNKEIFNKNSKTMILFSVFGLLRQTAGGKM
jgi:hypothetical protein